MHKYREDRMMPSPDRSEINDPIFGAIFDVIKKWDISVSEYHDGYKSGNGSHVKLILDAVRSVNRDKKIDILLNS